MFLVPGSIYLSELDLLSLVFLPLSLHSCLFCSLPSFSSSPLLSIVPRLPLHSPCYLSNLWGASSLWPVTGSSALARCFHWQAITQCHRRGKNTTTYTSHQHKSPHQPHKKVLEVVLEQWTLNRVCSLEMTGTGLCYQTILFLERDYKSPLWPAQLYHTLESSTSVQVIRDVLTPDSDPFNIR